ncbi:hypothetical protein Vadar_022803 [Vaccinium darrowii]|uniref:Uncharacterized protein n=1 Tax=Vaccinium darrowii TaxID=229202 RepID=A0ACB7X2V5_9ERIC|nr:hypothetical protein Vadar_022803 [Vaccinium darrowii]
MMDFLLTLNYKLNMHCLGSFSYTLIKSLSLLPKGMSFIQQEKLFSSENRTEASLGKKLKNDMLPKIEKVASFMIESLSPILLVDLVMETNKVCEDLIFNHLKQHFPSHKMIDPLDGSKTVFPFAFCFYWSSNRKNPHNWCGLQPNHE